ncbi:MULTISPECIES: hypothetical protein [Mycobacterium]|uniref:Uncharacterized protein n=2 Tax=Mycobacterium TaxID=1763 RepID=A0A1X0KK21_MYCSC|nr:MULTISPECIES: hypothetical protein [Mycobacterium]MBX9639668.1 hypothetical protein [Mycobacteriaceae bacterium]MCV7120112.1 hypothetical protein [Mycobacterium nebraskense]AFC42721.1 hypothetical protein OCU_15020 [Mycobacterium intracellulare ATCC 13950]AFC47822.1 hypothetical protein OCO_14590 [Mycobacterium intracellulare MOTT-02]ASW94589.1 hypothetical protein CKJ67_07365 [Mycobacterium intracellulare]
MFEVACVMAGFQRLATAVGVAQQGDKALGHQLDADIRRRTDLLLRSPPGAGSIILTLTPATSPIAETGHDGGKVGMFAELSKLKASCSTPQPVRRSMCSAPPTTSDPARTIGLCATAHRDGPRTASALRDLSKTLDRARCDIEIDWQQPSRAIHRVMVSSTAAAHVAATVETPTSMNNPYTSSANTALSTPSRGSSSKTTATPSPANSEKWDG